MAYCVHCGVKLGEGEKKCPLCKTISVDPHAPSPAKDAPSLYPTHTDEQLLIRSKRYFLGLFALLLLIPALLCLLIDFLVGGQISWSIYAFTALILLYIAIAVPIWVDKQKAYFGVVTAYGCLMLYLKMVETVSHSGNWFFPIVLPSITLYVLLTLLLIHLFHRGILGRFTLCGAILIQIALLCAAVDILVSLAAGKGLFLWSPYVFAPCLFVAALIFFINYNRTIREEIRRRTHF